MAEKSWKHGNGEAAMLLASVYENSDDKEDQEKAFRWYERAAEAGIPEALAELAYDYDQGFVVEKTERKLSLYIRKPLPWATKKASCPSRSCASKKKTRKTASST